MEELNAARKDYCAPMHTAEHILNRTMDNMFGCGRAFSAHIEAKKSKCDYRFAEGAQPSEGQLKEVEAAVNSIIAQGLDVRAEVVTREEAAKVADLSRLPAGASEMVRLVYVGGYDVCLCIGQHVQNTREIGAFRITSSSYSDGVLRLRWKAGGNHSLHLPH